LSKYIDEDKGSLKIIDIGANIGDTAFLISTYKKNIPILCIEGSKEYLHLLRFNLSKNDNSKLVECFVGMDNTQNLSILSDGKGSSTLKIDDSNMVELKSLDKILLDEFFYKDFNLIKIDTDGYDCDIIKGNIGIIERNKATIFFEYAPSFFHSGVNQNLAIFEFLQAHKYPYFIFYNSRGELLFTVDSLNSVNTILSIHEYFIRAGRYADIVVLHETEKLLYENILNKEFAYLRNIKL
jgi:FkbM family methyltransferase